MPPSIRAIDVTITFQGHMFNIPMPLPVDKPHTSSDAKVMLPPLLQVVNEWVSECVSKQMGKRKIKCTNAQMNDNLWTVMIWVN